MKTTGTARTSCATCFCRPIRCCSAEKGSGRSSRKASTSPSRTVPSGRRLAAAAISGKRWVMSSSPRDQRCRTPPRLTSCARMPSHFHSTSQPLTSPERLDRILERRREKERIRPRAVVVGALVREERGEPLRGRRPLAHDPRCERRGRQLRRLGQRADDERLRDADAQLAGEELEEDEPLQPVERAPPGGDALLLRCRIQALERQDAVLDPARKRQILGWGRRQLVEDERRRLRAVADDRVALFEEPGRQPRGRERPAVDRRIGQQALQPPAGEEEDRPGRVRRRSRRKVRGHRGDLGVGRRRAVDGVVEAGEAVPC